MIGLGGVERLEAIGKTALALTDSFLIPDLVLLSIKVVVNDCDRSSADIGTSGEQRDCSRFSADSSKGV